MFRGGGVGSGRSGDSEGVTATVLIAGIPRGYDGARYGLGYVLVGGSEGEKAGAGEIAEDGVHVDRVARGRYRLGGRFDVVGSGESG